jgi:hypothetical protein
MNNRDAKDPNRQHKQRSDKATHVHPDDRAFDLVEEALHASSKAGTVTALRKALALLEEEHASVSSTGIDAGGPALGSNTIGAGGRPVASNEARVDVDDARRGVGDPLVDVSSPGVNRVTSEAPTHLEAWNELQWAAEAYTKAYNGPGTAPNQAERLKVAAMAYAFAPPPEPQQVSADAPQLDLDALERAHKATTPGAWGKVCHTMRSGPDFWTINRVVAGNVHPHAQIVRVMTSDRGADDAGFIHLAHEKWPELIAEVRRLRADPRRERATDTTLEAKEIAIWAAGALGVVSVAREIVGGKYGHDIIGLERDLKAALAALDKLVPPQEGT